jgi:nucleotide-binding universal stress UspA family protein
MPIPGVPVSVEPVAQGEVERARAEIVNAFAPSVARGVPVDVEVELGLPAREILRRAGTLPADLIVMGTHGAGGFEHLMLGSVTEKVLRRAPCPVLTVPPFAEQMSLPPRHVLCAVDFSPAALDGVQIARSIAGHAGAALTLMTVLEWPWNEPPEPSLAAIPAEQGTALQEYQRYIESRARARLDALTGERNHGVRQVVRHGKPHVQIVREALDHGADLIVVGVHGRNAFDLAFLGSTANQVIRHASCAVLTVRK